MKDSWPKLGMVVAPFFDQGDLKCMIFSEFYFLCTYLLIDGNDIWKCPLREDRDWFEH